MNTKNLKIGYAMSSEEHLPNDLVRHARMAEETGFTFALISDHFHPWIDDQGQSPFVWSVLGGIAQVTERLEVGTGVTCPTIRIHPVIIAQAAATVAAMMPGRFFLGVGTGENLNEHILGDRWPAYQIRADMLEEAIEVIRLLWEGGMQSHYGEYYTVENARLYTLPETPPPLMVAASGTDSARLAGKFSDGLISVVPDAEVVKEFNKHADGSLPRYGKLTICWAESEKEARKTAYHYWRNAALKGGLASELPLPSQFDGASKNVTEEDVAEVILCGSEPQIFLDSIQKFSDAGYDHIYIHQVGQDQEGFFKFFEKHLAPELGVPT